LNKRRQNTNVCETGYSKGGKKAHGRRPEKNTAIGKPCPLATLSKKRRRGPLGRLAENVNGKNRRTKTAKPVDEKKRKL